MSAQNIELSGNLFVSGSSTLSESLDVDGMLDVSGDAFFGSRLDVSGDVVVDGSLDISGGVRLEDRLDVSGDVVVDGTLDVSGEVRFGDRLDVSGDVAVDGNVGIGGGHSSEKLKVYGDVNITGNIIVDGSFSFSEVVQNTTTINNTLLVSTQLDISNEGTGPALKVSQLGDGDDQDVALFNAGDEGDALKIDSSGNTFAYKDVDISGHTYLKDVSCNGSVDICGGSLTIVGNTSDDPIMTIRKNDDGVVFDTIVIRRVSDNETMNLRELQLWVNDVNILPDVITASTDVSNQPLGTTTEFFNNLTGLTEVGYIPDSISYVASRIANNNIPSSTNFDTVSIDTGPANNSSLYIPMDISMNSNNIQSFVLYNWGNSRYVFRAIGLRIELYNRSNDTALSYPLAYTNTISSAVNVYRFDFPAISTYTTFVTTDSSLNITSNALISDQITYTRPGLRIENAGLEVDGGNVDICGGSFTIVGNDSDDPIMTIRNETNTQEFDTIVIRRPTGQSFDDNTFQIHLRELQVWVNGDNVLPPNATSALFSLWDVDKDTDLGQYNDFYATNIYDEILSDVGIASSAIAIPDTDPDVALIINLSSSLNVVDIQSIVLYNFIGDIVSIQEERKNRAVGLSIELYNRAIDSTLSSPVAFTNTIETGVNVYRFDFPAISTYTGTFVSADSTTNIVSESYAQHSTDITFNDVIDTTRTGLKIENADLSVSGVINQTGASWSRGGVSVNVSTVESENIPWDGFAYPERNCIYSNRRIYIQKAGRYMVGITALSAEGFSEFQLWIMKNNVEVLRLLELFLSNVKRFQTISGQIILDLVVGDSIGISQVSGNIFNNLRYSSFYGYLIG